MVDTKEGLPYSCLFVGIYLEIFDDWLIDAGQRIRGVAFSSYERRLYLTTFHYVSWIRPTHLGRIKQSKLARMILASLERK